MKTIVALVTACSLVLGAHSNRLLEYYQTKNAEILRGLPGFQNTAQNPLLQGTNTQEAIQIDQQQRQSYQNTGQNQYQQQTQGYVPTQQNQNEFQQNQNVRDTRNNQYIQQQTQGYDPTRQSQNDFQQRQNAQDIRSTQYNQQAQAYDPKQQSSGQIQAALHQTNQDGQSVGQVSPGFQNSANIPSYGSNNRQVTPLRGDAVDSYLSNRNPGSGQNVPLSPPSNNQPFQNYYTQNAGVNQQTANLQSRYGASDVQPLLNVNLNVEELSSSISNFGLNFLNNVGPSQQNLVFSPLSVATVLALLQQGARGNTQAELTNALHMTPDVAAVAFSKLTTNVKQRTSSRNSLELATNLFISDSFNINNVFKRNAIKNFGSDVTKAFFSKGNEAEKAINKWVSDKTHNKIEQLGFDDIGANTKILLANVVYFKGTWEKRFNPDATVPKEFKLKNGQNKMVPFMRMRNGFQAGIDPNNRNQVISIPFDGNLYSLMIILPPELSDTTKVLSTLTSKSLKDYSQMPVREVFLEIPKFSVRSDYDLVPVLKKIGVKTVFTESADLYDVGSYLSFSPFVSSALHTAVLSIDEKGGTAAASTAFAAVALSFDENSMEFKVDKPFIAVLWDTKAEMPLFLARIEDPSISS